MKEGEWDLKGVKWWWWQRTREKWSVRFMAWNTLFLVPCRRICRTVLISTGIYVHGIPSIYQIFPSFCQPWNRYATLAHSRWATSESKSSLKRSRVRAVRRNTNLHCISTQGMLRLIKQLILPRDDSRKLNRAARSGRMSEIVCSL